LKLPPPLRTVLANTGLVLASLLASAALCELVVFRLVLLPSDVPGNVYLGGLVRLEPGARGVWRVRDEVAAPFRINAQGWNSGAGDYERAPAGTTRIAVIGDSYVEALQVPAVESLAEQLEGLLDAAATPTRVYRFGISGAPLSQYLRMLERAALDYDPHWIVVVLVHNDFGESFRFQPGRYTSSFLKLRVAEGRVLGELEPTPYRRTWHDPVRQLATVRYLYYRQQITPAVVRSRVRALLAGAGSGYREASAAARDGEKARRGADVAPGPDDLEAATAYLFDRLFAAAGDAGARLLLLMDGDRGAIYGGRSDGGALELNRLATRLAAERGIAFVDLHERFAADWARHRQRFDFPSDAHWNRRGHGLAARAIAEHLRGSGEASPRRPSSSVRG
jgi:hypothetical protein